MDIRVSIAILGVQGKKVQALNGRRFVHDGYEYEIRCESGIAEFCGLYRRKIGCRNFKFHNGIGCRKSMEAESALQRVCRLLPPKM